MLASTKAQERRAWTIAALVGSLATLGGCSRPNPLFGADATSGATGSANGTDTTQRTTSGPPTTDTTTSAAVVTETSPGSNDTTGSDSLKPQLDAGGLTSGQGSDTTKETDSGSSGAPVRPGVVVVFAATEITGDFAQPPGSPWELAIDHCAGSLDRVGIELRCPTLWPFLAVDGVPLEGLPEKAGGEALISAEVVGVDGTLVAESFEAFAAGEVEPTLQPAVGDIYGLGETIQTWAGETVDGGPAMGTCANWSSAEAEGETRTYADTMPTTAFSTESCAEPHYLLCLCF